MTEKNSNLITRKSFVLHIYSNSWWLGKQFKIKKVYVSVISTKVFSQNKNYFMCYAVNKMEIRSNDFTPIH